MSMKIYLVNCTRLTKIYRVSNKTTRNLRKTVVGAGPQSGQKTKQPNSIGEILKWRGTV